MSKWLPRLDEGERMPMQLGWLGWGLVAFSGRWPLECYYAVTLLLPSWRFEESWCDSDAPEWQRLALLWHGKHGFALRWLPERWL